MLIYGGSGVGKTILALNSQRHHTFVFDVDRSTHSAWAWRGREGSPTPSTRVDLIHLWPVVTLQDLREGQEWLMQNQSRFGLVVLDSGSELQRSCIRETCKRRNHIIADQQDWNVILQFMLDTATWFRALPMHCIWTAHERHYQDSDLGRTVWRPAFQGQFGDEVLKHFSEVWRYLTWDQQVRQGDQIGTLTHHALKCWRDPVTEAKDRSNALAQYEQPNLDALLDKMSASLLMETK